MLQDSFFDIVSESGTQFVLRFHPEHPIYAAHFPGQPLTPGVCFVQIAFELLEHFLSIDSIPSVERLVLWEKHEPQVELTASIAHLHNQKIKVTFESEGKRFSSVTILIPTEHDN